MPHERDITLTENEIARFWSRIDIKDDKEACWFWKRKCERYGQFGVKRDGKIIMLRAHRLSWILTNGQPIPKELGANHKCGKMQCCNPNHIYLGTDVENAHDKIGHGTNIEGEDHYCAKLSDGDIRKMFIMRQEGRSHPEIAASVGIEIGSVSYILNGKRRKSVTLALIKEFNIQKFKVRRCDALLTYEQAEEIRRQHASGIMPRFLAKEWNMSKQMITKIVSRRCYATSVFV